MASTKGSGAAVHDRHFRSVDFDDGVVDAETAQRGQQMFGGRAQWAVSVAQHGGKFGRGHRAHVGADLARHRTVVGETLEHDAGVVVGRMHRKCDWRTGMNTNAGDGNVIAQRRLLSALHLPATRPRHIRARSQSQTLRGHNLSR